MAADNYYIFPKTIRAHALPLGDLYMLNVIVFFILFFLVKEENLPIFILKVVGVLLALYPLYIYKRFCIEMHEDRMIYYKVFSSHEIMYRNIHTILKG